MYDINELYEAESPTHAVELLRQYPEAKIIAGGSDILIKIREGKLAGCTLISIQKVDELRGVTLNLDGALRIGPLTSFSHIAADPLILQHIPVLAVAAQTVGGPQLRNIATIGGNICNGVTSADSASTLLAFDAVLEYLGPNGVRQVPITEHYVSAGKTALAPDEILQAILIPKASYENCYGYYIKYAMRNALDIATLGCSANVKIGTRDQGSGIGVRSSEHGDSSGLYSYSSNNDPQSPISDPQSLSSHSPLPTPHSPIIQRLRLAYGVAGPVPLRAFGAETAAIGKPADAKTVAEIAKAALSGINPRTSWRASKEFRLHLAEELAKRAITEALKRAGVSL
jgi:xanthine dehydrogenase FAD-binding subunit